MTASELFLCFRWNQFSYFTVSKKEGAPIEVWEQCSQLGQMVKSESAFLTIWGSFLIFAIIKEMKFFWKIPQSWQHWLKRRRQQCWLAALASLTTISKWDQKGQNFWQPDLRRSLKGQWYDLISLKKAISMPPFSSYYWFVLKANGLTYMST